MGKNAYYMLMGLTYSNKAYEYEHTSKNNDTEQLENNKQTNKQTQKFTYLSPASPKDKHVLDPSNFTSFTTVPVVVSLVCKCSMTVWLGPCCRCTVKSSERYFGYEFCKQFYLILVTIVTF